MLASPSPASPKRSPSPTPITIFSTSRSISSTSKRTSTISPHSAPPSTSPTQPLPLPAHPPTLSPAWARRAQSPSGLARRFPFATTQVGSYAVETAIEEGKHVGFLRTALGSLAVAQPALDLNAAFNTLANAAGIGPAFDPFASDATFLVGAYIFEDVGVTAYLGAASLITQTTAGKAILGAAAGILAVEAYHAGLVRTTLNQIDTTGVLTGYTTKISALRTTLAKAALSTTPVPDDYGIAHQTVSLLGTSGLDATRLVDADSTNVVAFSRNTAQELNIVTGGGAVNGSASVSPAKGVFFPAGMNGLFK